MNPTKLTPLQRNTVYCVLAGINAFLCACVQQDVIPASWGQGTAIATFILAALMKQFGSGATPMPPTEKQ